MSIPAGCCSPWRCPALRNVSSGTTRCQPATATRLESARRLGAVGHPRGQGCRVEQVAAARGALLRRAQGRCLLPTCPRWNQQRPPPARAVPPVAVRARSRLPTRSCPRWNQQPPAREHGCPCSISSRRRLVLKVAPPPPGSQPKLWLGSKGYVCLNSNYFFCYFENCNGT
jgi:hypothetical protein